MALGDLSWERLKTWVHEEYSKYFLKTKIIHSTMKQENIQPYFSIMWTFGFFQNTFPVNCTLLVHKSKQCLSGTDGKNYGAWVVWTFPSQMSLHFCNQVKHSMCADLVSEQFLLFIPPAKFMSHVWASWDFVNCNKWSQFFFFQCNWAAKIIAFDNTKLKFRECS